MTPLKAQVPVVSVLFSKNHASGTTRIDVSKHDYHASQREAPLYRACGAASHLTCGQEALGSHQGPIEASQTSSIDPSGIVFFLIKKKRSVRLLVPPPLSLPEVGQFGIFLPLGFYPPPPLFKDPDETRGGQNL